MSEELEGGQSSSVERCDQSALHRVSGVARRRRWARIGLDFVVVVCCTRS